MDAAKPSWGTTELFNSATHWLRMLRERRIGAVELLNLHLAQVEKHNTGLNLVVATDVEAALDAAREADNRGPSDQSPLHGLPMTIKDTLEVTGMPATAGFSFLSDHLPQGDADAVVRLKSAGAVIFGKTNVPPGAFDWQSYNEHYGVSNNPWNSSRTPGGSSGGAAGAVAAAFTPLEVGSDLGGSIRVPASFCGVYGHKPSYGVVPIRGHIPPLPGHRLEFEMGVLGPLARSAHDLELAMDVLAAPGILDEAAWRVTIPPSRHERLEDFRVAVWVDDTYAVDDQYGKEIEAFLEDLRAIGVRLDRAARPEFDPASSYETYLTALLSIAGAGLPEPAVQALLDTAAALPADSDNYVARFARALTLRHVQYLATAEQRAILRWAWRAFFTQYDLVIAPSFPTVAYEHDHRGIDLPDPISAGQSRTLSVSGEERPYFDSLQWPSLAVVADLPATAIPTGKLVEGLPVGVQLIAPFLEDRTSLRFAQLLEREIGGASSPPAPV